MIRFTVFLTLTACVALAQADPSAEIRKSLPEAASLPSKEWDALQAKPSTIEEMSQKGLGTLTFAVLSMPLHAEVELDLVPEKEVRPDDLRGAIGKSIASCLQKDYIKDMTCSVKDGVATGEITAEIPKFGKLIAQYSARSQGVTWKIVEFRLPKSGIVCALDEAGAWKIQWTTPQAAALSLVYSFGAVRLFGRTVFNYADGKWETLEKIFADRAERPDSGLFLSGSGPGWTWSTVRQILTRAKNVKRFKIRAGDAAFEFTRPAPAVDKPMRLHLCVSRKLLEGHLKDSDKHAADVRKAAEEPSFGDETFVWADEATGQAIVQHHPMSDDETLSADRKALAKFVRSFPAPPGVVLNPDPHVSFDHVMHVIVALQKAGIKSVRLPD